MRTKTLLLTAALSAAGVATSMAQVYSVNAVGYVNITIQPGLNLFHNPLNNNSPDNTVVTLFPNAPESSQVFKYDPTNLLDPYHESATLDPFDGWVPANFTLAPGEGFYFRNNSGAPYHVTFVGEVRQGADSNDSFVQGRQLIGSIVPIAAGPNEQPPAGIPAAFGSQIKRFFNDGTTSGFVGTATYDEFDVKWIGNDTPIRVGEGFFLEMTSATNWTRNFSVNP